MLLHAVLKLFSIGDDISCHAAATGGLWISKTLESHFESSGHRQSQQRVSENYPATLSDTGYPITLILNEEFCCWVGKNLHRYLPRCIAVRTMLVTVWQQIGAPMWDRTKGRCQTKRATLVLQVGGCAKRWKLPRKRKRTHWPQNRISRTKSYVSFKIHVVLYEELLLERPRRRIYLRRYQFYFRHLNVGLRMSNKSIEQKQQRCASWGRWRDTETKIWGTYCT
jgi:hypothetical protein